MTGPAPTEGPLTLEELQLAARNKGMPLETLAYDITPTGLHYLLVHFDIPVLDASSFRLQISGHVRRPLELDLADLRAPRAARSRSRRGAPATGALGSARARSASRG